MLVLRSIRRWLLALALLALTVPARAADIDQYLPSDTQAVLTVNVRQILDSPLIKKHALGIMKAFLQSNAEAQKILKPLGFDPLTDVSSFTFAGPGGSDQSKGLVLVHGKFDVEKFRTKADELAKQDEKKLKVTKEGDYTLYTTEIEQQGNSQTMYMAIVDDTTLAASPSKNYVVQVLDQKAGKGKSELKADLKGLLEKADANQSISFVALGDVLRKSPLAGDSDKAKDLLAKIESITGGLTISDEFKMDVNIASKDEDAAKELTKDIKEGLERVKGMAAFFANERKELAPLVEALNNVKIDAKGTNVSVRGEITNEVIEKALSERKASKKEGDKDKEDKDKEDKDK